MKLTVLTDNNTYIDAYFKGEPALSFYLECEGRKFLFDTGYSDVFLENAEKMGISLANLDGIILSHGHNDHTGGLAYLPPMPQTFLLAHPQVFEEKVLGKEDVGSPLSRKECEERFQLRLSKEPYALTEKLTYLGEIPVSCEFEPRTPIGSSGGKEDLLFDDTALAYRTEQGLFIITGCSHSGICNIMEYAKKVCKESRIVGVIGGFHLLETGERLQKTIAYFQQNRIRQLYPCHCVSFAAKAEIHTKCCAIQEVGCGMILEF